MSPGAEIHQAHLQGSNTADATASHTKTSPGIYVILGENRQIDSSNPTIQKSKLTDSKHGQF